MLQPKAKLVFTIVLFISGPISIFIFQNEASALYCIGLLLLLSLFHLFKGIITLQIEDPFSRWSKLIYVYQEQKTNFILRASWLSFISLLLLFCIGIILRKWNTHLTMQLNRCENLPMLSKPYFLYISLPTPTAYCGSYESHSK